MRYLIVLVAVLCTAATARAAPPIIYVVNHSSLPTEAVMDALPAFQQAIDEDFGPEWNAYATLKLVDKAPRGWQIDLVDGIDLECWGCAGYHRVKNRFPYAQVGVDLLSWQLVFTHELFEMLADPYIDRGAYIRKCNLWGCTTDKVLAIEVADPVEALHWAYNRKSASGMNVIISDFVTEAYYRCQGGKLDFVGHIKRCHQILYGGYQYVLKDNNWHSYKRYEFRR